MEKNKRISKKQESQSNTSLILLCCVIFLICIVALYLVNTTGTRTLLQINDITDTTGKKSIQLPQRPERLVSSIYGSIAHAKVNTLAMNTSESSNSTVQNQSESQNVSNNISAENTFKENIDKPQENENKENIDRPWKSQENENKEKVDKPQENENKENIDRPWKKKENESKEDSVRPWKSKSNDSKKEISECKRVNKENKEQKTKENKEKEQKTKENKEKEQKTKENKEKEQKTKENKEKEQKTKENKEKEQKTKENKEKEQKTKEKESKEKDKKTKEEPKKDSKNKKEDKGKPLEEHLAMLYLKTTPGNWVKEPVKNDRVLLSLLEKSTQFRIGIHLYDTKYIRRLALENSDVVSVDNASQMFEKIFKPQIEKQFTKLSFRDSRAKYPGIGNVKKREGTGISKDKLRMKYYALLVQIKFKTQFYYCVFGMPFSQYKRTHYAIESILRQMYFKEK